MADGAIHWVAFDAQVLESSLKSGRTVFLDVTGMGCALCMVNKRVYKDQKVQTLLTQPDIVCMRADFSHGDNHILLFLKRYGRAAIPFNVVLSRYYPKGIVLNEVLSTDQIFQSIELIKKFKKNALTTEKESPYTKNMIKKK